MNQQLSLDIIRSFANEVPVPVIPSGPPNLAVNTPATIPPQVDLVKGPTRSVLPVMFGILITVGVVVYFVERERRKQKPA